MLEMGDWMATAMEDGMVVRDGLLAMERSLSSTHRGRLKEAQAFGSLQEVRAMSKEC